MIRNAFVDSNGRTTTQKDLSTYPLHVRLEHWVLSRMGLLQAFCLFMWMAERASKSKEQPPYPWIVYVHAMIGLFASTGISARFMARLSLTVLIFSQLHLTWLFLFASWLDYIPCVRIRLGLRCLASAGIYLRILGIGQHMFKEETSATKFCFNMSNTYNLGLSLMSIASALLGFLSIPATIFRLDQELQSIETASTWPIFIQLQTLIGSLLACGFSVAGFSYSLPLLVQKQTTLRYNQLSQFLCHLADLGCLICLFLVTFLRDIYLDYWTTKNCEFWLIILNLLENFTIFLGILIINSLLNENQPSDLNLKDE